MVSKPIFDPTPLPPHRHEVRMADGTYWKSQHGTFRRADELHLHAVRHIKSWWLDWAPNVADHTHDFMIGPDKSNHLLEGWCGICGLVHEGLWPHVPNV